MSERKAVVSESAPRPLPVFSQAIQYGDTVYCSGSIGATPDGKLVEGGIGARTTQALTNLDNVLRAAGSGLENALKLTVFITDYSKFGEMNEAYLKMMPSPAPARSCIGVKELPFGTDVEIEVVAALKREPSKL